MHAHVNTEHVHIGAAELKGRKTSILIYGHRYFALSSLGARPFADRPPFRAAARGNPFSEKPMCPLCGAFARKNTCLENKLLRI